MPILPQQVKQGGGVNPQTKYHGPKQKYKIIGRCRAGIKGTCKHMATSRHHIKPRRDGGSDAASNLMKVCWPCHKWIHKNEDKARDVGWLR